MPELVLVSKIDTLDKLKTYLVELFQQERYEAITQAIGMYSLLIDPQHTINDQSNLYHDILNMLKERVSKAVGNNYGSWYFGFPKIMDQIITTKRIVTDKNAAEALSSHRAAYGPFKSLDEFFFWALDDRRLPLEQIIKYIEQTRSIISC